MDGEHCYFAVPVSLPSRLKHFRYSPVRCARQCYTPMLDRYMSTPNQKRIVDVYKDRPLKTPKCCQSFYCNLDLARRNFAGRLKRSLPAPVTEPPQTQKQTHVQSMRPRFHASSTHSPGMLPAQLLSTYEPAKSNKALLPVPRCIEE